MVCIEIWCSFPWQVIMYLYAHVVALHCHSSLSMKESPSIKSCVYKSASNDKCKQHTRPNIPAKHCAYIVYSIFSIWMRCAMFSERITEYGKPTTELYLKPNCHSTNNTQCLCCSLSLPLFRISNIKRVRIASTYTHTTHTSTPTESYHAQKMCEQTSI